MWSTIREFGLEYCDLPTMFWNVGIHLRTLALNIDRRNKSIPVAIYVWVVFSFICCFYVHVVNMAWFVFWYTPDLLAEVKEGEGGDIIFSAIIIFSRGLMSLMSTTKLLFMYIHRDRLQRIVAGGLELDAQVVPNSRFSANLLHTLRVVKIRALVFWSALIMDGAVYIVLPLLRPGRHFYADEFVFLALTPMFESPNYEINYIIQSVAASMVVYVSANVIVLFMIVIGYIEAQLLALSDELIHLWDEAVQHSQAYQLKEEKEEAKKSINQKEVNDYVKERLKATVRLHTTYIHLIKETEYILKRAILVQFMLVIMALIGELTIGLENTWLDAQYALMFVGVDCFVGQRLVDANEAFVNAVYDSKWEKFDVANRKSVLLMLRNTQKTLQLSAGGMVTLNFESWMAMIKLVYSAYTTLRARM